MQKIMISLYVLTASLALVVLKLGSKAGAPAQLVGDRLHINLTPYTIVGIALYGLSFVLYTYLISRYELSYIIPITAAFGSRSGEGRIERLASEDGLEGGKQRLAWLA